MKDLNVTIKVTEEQAEIISRALEVYMRLGLGQVEEVNNLIAVGYIPSVDKKDTCYETIGLSITEIKKELGLSRFGSYSILWEGLSKSPKISYEIYKTIDKTLAVGRNPNPTFYTPDYDGVKERLTDLPLPEVEYVRKQAESA